MKKTMEERLAFAKGISDGPTSKPKELRLWEYLTKELNGDTYRSRKIYDYVTKYYK